MKYIHRLDLIRLLAITAVILQHYFPNSALNIFPNAKFGVILFFVLSGYLISYILLGYKKKINSKKISLKQSLKIFYARRTIRIFPLYYMALLFLLLFNFSNISEKFGWYAFYSSNIFSYLQQSWDGNIGPFWSLAVEEQFYLIWPFVILLLPIKKFFKFSVLLIFLAPFIRLGYLLYAQYSFDNFLPELSHIMPFASIDSFALGAVLAILKKYKLKLSSLKVSVILFFSSLILVFVVSEFHHTHPILYIIILPLILSFLSFSLIDFTLRADKFETFKFEKPFMFLGKISYGLYVYHCFIWSIWAIFKVLFAKVFPNNNSLTYFENLFENKSYLWILLLVICATLSWYLIEKPINNLKKYFTI